MTPPRTGPTPPSRPAAADDPSAFVRAVARSRLLDRARLDTTIAALPAAVRRSARAVADHLVAAAVLTHYQAEKLLLGISDGLVLGPYHVLAPLGRGGMGAVYLARLGDSEDEGVKGRRGDGVTKPAAGSPPHPFTPSPLLALKVLPPQHAGDDRALARFRREVELGRHLSHPHVARTLDAGEAGGVHYIVMEYVPGRTVRQAVTADGPMAAATAARVFADVAAGLSYAHGRGLIHRDLKPSNVMVTPDGRAKVLDLGLALLVDEVLPDDPQVVGGRGYILGSMDYIAPEQTADATDVGPRSDLYALGCSLYFALTGLPPFPGGTAKQKMRWHRTEDPPAVDHLNPAVPGALARLVERLMAKRPADRPGSAGVVRELLLPWAADEPVAAVAVLVREADVLAAADDPAGWDRSTAEPAGGWSLELPIGPATAALLGLVGVLAAFAFGVLVGLVRRL